LRLLNNRRNLPLLRHFMGALGFFSPNADHTAPLTCQPVDISELGKSDGVRII
jgi:hypothetical protein